jgi:hypothetical protein
MFEVKADLRKKCFRGKDVIWCAIEKSGGHFLEVSLTAVESPQAARGLPCVKLRKSTVQRLRRKQIWRAAEFTYYLLGRKSCREVRKYDA